MFQRFRKSWGLFKSQSFISLSKPFRTQHVLQENNYLSISAGSAAKPQSCSPPEFRSRSNFVTVQPSNTDSIFNLHLLNIFPQTHSIPKQQLQPKYAGRHFTATLRICFPLSRPITLPQPDQALRTAKPQENQSPRWDLS